MRIIKKILIGFGAIFVGFICLFAYLFYSSASFLDENQQFIEQFSHDLAVQWDPQDVHDRLTNSFLAVVATPDGKRSFNQLRLLGRLQKTSDFEMGNYNAGTDGTRATVTFKATFDNAKGLVTVSLVEKDGKLQVEGFHFLPSGGETSPSAGHKQEA